MDIPAANVVIRFDAIYTPVSMIQSRGRARKSNSSFIVMKEVTGNGKKRTLDDLIDAEQRQYNIISKDYTGNETLNIPSNSIEENTSNSSSSLNNNNQSTFSSTNPVVSPPTPYVKVESLTSIDQAQAKRIQSHQARLKNGMDYLKSNQSQLSNSQLQLQILKQYAVKIFGEVVESYQQLGKVPNLKWEAKFQLILLDGQTIETTTIADSKKLASQLCSKQILEIILNNSPIK